MLRVGLFLGILSAVLPACGDDGARPVLSAGASGDAGAPGAVGTGGGSAGATPGNGGAPAGPFCAELEPEPNDTRPDAVSRGDLNDCDDSGATMTGTLAGLADVDVWSWQASDTLGCIATPVASSADVLRLCMFAQCDAGGSVGCFEGSPSSFEGLHGCCQQTPGRLELELACAGVSDDAILLVTAGHDPLVPGIDRDCYDYTAAVHF